MQKNKTKTIARVIRLLLKICIGIGIIPFHHGSPLFEIKPGMDIIRHTKHTTKYIYSP